MPSVRCPVCGTPLSTIVRAVPVPVGPAPTEATPTSSVIEGAGGPSNPADDAHVIGSPTSNEYNSGDSDSSLQTTVFDFVPRSALPLTDITANALPEVTSPKPEDVSSSPSSATVVPTNIPAKGATQAVVPAKHAEALRNPSPLMFKLAVSYASAVTLVCLYLAYLLSQRNPTLDLPDLAPPAKSEHRVTTLLYVPRETELHPAQQLRLGEARQYGSLRVTPLRVARGPLQFDFFDPVAGEIRPATEPVLKLYMRFENVSTTQVVVPLDRHLVFTKEPDRKNFGWFKANNFVCAAGERSEYDRHVLVYDLSPESEWLIQEENLDYALKPGESVVSFIPTTEEGWDALSGSLVWRVHLRKGYNPTSLRGVTTLIEVMFNSTDIVSDGRHGCGTS